MLYRFNVAYIKFSIIMPCTYLFWMHVTFTKDLYCHITNLSYFTGTLFINPEAFDCSVKTPYINSFIHKFKSNQVSMCYTLWKTSSNPIAEQTYKGFKNIKSVSNGKILQSRIENWQTITTRLKF